MRQYPSIWDEHTPLGMVYLEKHILNLSEPRTLEEKRGFNTRMCNTLREGCHQTLELYSTILEQSTIRVVHTGKQLVDLYLSLGETNKVDVIYILLKPIFKQQGDELIASLKQKRTERNKQAFEALIQGPINTLLTQYEMHQQWSQGLALIDDVFKQITLYVTEPKPNIILLKEKRTLLLDYQNKKQLFLPVSVYITESQFEKERAALQALVKTFQTSTSSEKHVHWEKGVQTMLQNIITRIVTYLGEPPTAFSLLGQGDMSRRKSPYSTVMLSLIHI